MFRTFYSKFCFADDTDCKLPDTEIGETGDCGKFATGIAFMIMYLTLRLVIRQSYNQKK